MSIGPPIRSYFRLGLYKFSFTILIVSMVRLSYYSYIICFCKTFTQLTILCNLILVWRHLPWLSTPVTAATTRGWQTTGSRLWREASRASTQSPCRASLGPHQIPSARPSPQSTPSARLSTRLGFYACTPQTSLPPPQLGCPPFVCATWRSRSDAGATGTATRFLRPPFARPR